jgi:YesN/AraC family two-component response regulator
VNPRPRILFVDDEPGVLDGLRDLLRKERKRWDMVFAVDPADALRRLADSTFDVVVTDIRMPRMDGTQLLTIVRERFPSTVRIVLSGHADREALERAAGVADLALSKPCDAAVLRSTLVRAVAGR